MKSYLKSDGNGMGIEVYPNGSKYWRLRYRIAGKAKLISLGVYPEVSLKEAREKALELRKLIKDGIDPSQERKKDKLELKENVENTFENIAREWFKSREHVLSKRHSFYIFRRLEANIFPFIGSCPIKKIARNDILDTIRKIEQRGAFEVARRTLKIVGQVFRYAISIGKADYDLTLDLNKALALPPENRHYAFFSEKELEEFLKSFSSFKGSISTKLALQLLIYTFVRSGELRGAKWEEFDLEKKEWRIPAERMKMKEQHIVPLSKQVIELVNAIKLISNGSGLLFPCRTDINKPISDNTLSKGFRDQGYKGIATPHGMRATASTILNENGFAPDVIERQLAHSERNKIRAAYNHAMYLSERRKMMDWWGNYIEERMKND